MSPVLASPFKSPIAVLAKIKQWSSRKCQRDDPPTTTSPIPTLMTLKPPDSAGVHCSDPYCTPQLSRSCVLTTPDSGVHTGPLPPTQTGVGSPSVIQKGSSPIPITATTPTSSHCRKLKAVREALHCSKQVFSKDAHLDVTYTKEYHPQSPSNCNRNVQRPSITSVATTTTTLPSENSYSDSSENGESWCLKLSDLDSPACLSPRIPGWSKSWSESEKLPSKLSSEPDENIPRSTGKHEEYVAEDKLGQNVGSSEVKDGSCASFNIVQVMKDILMHHIDIFYNFYFDYLLQYATH